MTNDWLIQQLDELSEKSEYQDRALLYEIKKLMAEIDERTMRYARRNRRTILESSQLVKFSYK